MNQERAAIASDKSIFARDDDQTQMLNKLKKYVLNLLYSANVACQISINVTVASISLILQSAMTPE